MDGTAAEVEADVSGGDCDNAADQGQASPSRGAEGLTATKESSDIKETELTKVARDLVDFTSNQLSRDKQAWNLALEDCGLEDLIGDLFPNEDDRAKPASGDACRPNQRTRKPKNRKAVDKHPVVSANRRRTNETDKSAYPWRESPLYEGRCEEEKHRRQETRSRRKHAARRCPVPNAIMMILLGDVDCSDLLHEVASHQRRALHTNSNPNCHPNPNPNPNRQVSRHQ